MALRERVRWFEVARGLTTDALIGLLNERLRRLGDALTGIRVRKNSGTSTFERTRLNFIEGSNVTLTVADDAAGDEVDITIAASGGGGGGAPTDAQYVTLATNATLTQERVLTAGTGISIVDSGAGAAVTISATSATASGTATLDFGGTVTTETDTATVTVSDAGVGAGSEIAVTLRYAATADHTADEALISNVQVMAGNISAGVGFDIVGYCPEHTWGEYSVAWIRS